MTRRQFVRIVSAEVLFLSSTANVWPSAAPANGEKPRLDAATAKDWLRRWEKNILASERSRYCDKAIGEDMGWLVGPFLDGFYFGYLATRDSKWVERLVDWTDACLRRAVEEPDGYRGWPKGDGGGGSSDVYSADSLLGEAMVLRPVVLMADEIRKTPSLEKLWGAPARRYLEFAAGIFRKWDSRDCWREVPDGGLWVVPSFGIDLKTGRWSAGYEHRETQGFSNPANKQSLIARWLVSMADVTKDNVYRDRAAKWWQLLKHRMRPREDGKYLVWNYWDPAGPWDYIADGTTRHWVGVHANGGYYAIDVEGIVTAYEHNLVFTRADLDRLIATNREFMWNGQLTGAKFRRIDGREPDPRWKDSPGVLWEALAPYDETLRKILVANHNPDGWGALSTTPWILSWMFPPERPDRKAG